MGRPVPATGTGTKPAGILCRLFVESSCILVTFIMHFIPHCTLVCGYRDPRITENHCCRQWYSTCTLLSLYTMQLWSHACMYVSLTCIKLPSGFWREQFQAWAGSWLILTWSGSCMCANLDMIGTHPRSSSVFLASNHTAGCRCSCSYYIQHMMRCF